MSDNIRQPNFIIIGAPKSGTTSLFYYLKQHPDIYLPDRKELHYFSYARLAENTNGPNDRIIIDALCDTKEKYLSYYKNAREQKRIGEVSPSYLYYADVSGKILDELGKIKIIAILRNPIEKAHSQYMHLIRENLEILSFYDALMEEQKRRKAGWSDIWRYAESSLYTERIKKYISAFGSENVKVLLFDDLVAKPGILVQDLLVFLGIDPDISVDVSKVYNRTGKPRSRFAADFFAKPNAIKDLARTIIPDRIRIPLRTMLHNFNTGEKDPIDVRSKKYLSQYFKHDVEELQRLMDVKLSWL